MQRADAIADIAFLEHALEERFAYLKTNAVDYTSQFEELRRRLPDEVEPSWLGLQLQKLLAHFIDGHAAINAPPSPRGFTPFLTGAVGDALVAFDPEGWSLLDPELLDA